VLSDRLGNLADRGAEHNDAARSLVPPDDGPGAAAASSAANPKFASSCGTGVCELRVQKRH